MTLSEQIEAASADDERLWCERVFEAVWPQPFLKGLYEWNRKKRSFTNKLNAHAYLDAAMMLVPDGWRNTEFYEHDDGGVLWGLRRERGVGLVGEAANPALALLSAIAKARGL